MYVDASAPGMRLASRYHVYCSAVPVAGQVNVAGAPSVAVTGCSTPICGAFSRTVSVASFDGTSVLPRFTARHWKTASWSASSTDAIVYVDASAPGMRLASRYHVYCNAVPVAGQVKVAGSPSVAVTGCSTPICGTFSSTVSVTDVEVTGALPRLLTTHLYVER